MPPQIKQILEEITIKKIFALAFVLALCLSLFAGCSKTTPTHPIVEIEIRDYGTITVELDAEAAPITVENFLKLVEEGFYDGLTFHRIMYGYMMQGGDPEGTGFGGSDETIKGEFAANGVDNPLSHTRGAIFMARSDKPDSASSQFFICQQDVTGWDGQYACFGYVTEGMEVVDAVCAYSLTVYSDSSNTLNAEDQPVIEYIRVVD